jgi:predicted nucleic acid-binding protein
MQRYQAITTIVTPEPIERTVPTDADDDAVIATALAADGTLIVTGDSDLLVMSGLGRYGSCRQPTRWQRCAKTRSSFVETAA